MESGHKCSYKVLENARKKVMENHFQFSVCTLSVDMEMSGSLAAVEMCCAKLVETFPTLNIVRISGRLT